MKNSTIIDAQQLPVLPEFRKGNTLPDRIKTTLHPEMNLGTFSTESVINRLFFLTQVRAHFNADMLISPKAKSNSFVGIALMRSGVNTACFGHNEHHVFAQGGESAFVFNPGLPEVHHFKAHQPTQINYLEIDAKYFTDMMDAQNNKTLDRLSDKMRKGEFIEVCRGKVLPVHQRIVSDIYHCPLEGSLGDLMLEGSLQQLVALQLSLLGGDMLKIRETVNTRDKEIMYAVRSYLESSFLENHSLQSISRQFGINQTKLKKCFKALFSVSVIEFLYDLKMIHARVMLYEKKMFVAEVASMVGYKNANHFSTAFKRKFGINPSHLR